jgi:NAD+ synthase
METKKSFSKDLIKLGNVEETAMLLISKIRDAIFNQIKRKGGVIGISGGIDSSVTMALSVQALGKENILGLLLPEKDSSGDSARLATILASKFGVETLTEDISGALEGFGCYRRRDEAIKRVFPEFDPLKHKSKIGIKQPNLMSNLAPLFSLTIIDEKGASLSKLLPAKEFLQIVAASNFKQRSRMSMLYYHAECRYYAVIGTPNKHETEQGFFVKYGDGGADIMPIGNLYKTQVYQLARYLEIPEEIISRTPTTDTYSAEQTQEEFFFQMPFEQMDIIWYGYENGYSANEVAAELGISEKEIEGIYRNFLRKQLTTNYLRMAPIREF